MAGGPQTSREALDWIREAMREGRYILHPHAIERMHRRHISILDVREAIAHADKCAAYRDRKPTAGGTCWRVVGPDVAGDETSIGVEAFRDQLGRRVLIVTAF